MGIHKALALAAVVMAPLAIVPTATAQSESVAPGTGDMSGPASRALSVASREVLGALKLDVVLATPQATHVARFDATRGADPARRTRTQRIQLGKYLIATNRASTRFVPLATVTPRAAVYLAKQAAPSVGRSNVAARLGEALAFYRQLALYAGLAGDDIADAMTLDALLSYRNATGRSLDIFSDDSNRQPRDRALLQSVRDQMRNIVRHDADLQGMDGPQKRFVAEMHQMLAVLSVIGAQQVPIYSRGRQVRTDVAARSKQKREASLVFQFVTGHRPSQVRLSRGGFMPAPRAGR